MNATFTATDTLFHFSRVEEIYQNLKHSSLTWTSTRYFQQTGVGSYLFYPSYFLYIWALLRFVFSPIKAFYIWISLFIFITYLSSFYAMNSYCNNTRRSIIFSLIYTIVPYHLFLGLWNGTLGEFMAYSFLPLAFVGIYHVFWGNSNKWYLLTLGMTLVLYSHLVSSYIIAMFIAVVMLWKAIISHSLTKLRLIAFAKAVGFTILTTSPFLLLFCIEGPVATPTNSFIVLHDLKELVDLSINNMIGSNIGLILLVTAIIGLCFVRKNQNERYIYLTGVLFFIASSNIIPYKLFNHSKLMCNTLGLIQMPGRLLSFASLFLAVTASYIIVQIINNLSHQNLCILLMMLASIIMFWSETLPQYNLLNSIPLLTSETKQDIVLPGLKKVTNTNYNDMFQYIVPAGETDYYHRTDALKHSELNNLTKSIINHDLYINGKKEVKQPKSGPNYLQYTVEAAHKEKIDLPVVAYRNSYVKVNRQKVHKSISERGTISLQINPGMNRIEVEFKPPFAEYILFAIAIISWISLFIIMVFA